MTELPPKKLIINAFPYCIYNKKQSMDIFWNGRKLKTFVFPDCDEVQLEVEIPRNISHSGYNALDMKFSYATSPYEVTHGKNADKRYLSVGFSNFELEY